MKILYVFLFCFLAVILADDKKDCELSELQLVECRKYLGDEIENILDDPKEVMRTTTVYQRSCFFFCIEKKMGRMNENGTYNKEVMYKVITPDNKAEFENRLAYCENKIEPGNSCKMAGCLHVDAVLHGREL